MKKTLFIAAILGSAVTMSSCEVLNDVGGAVLGDGSGTTGEKSLTNEEVIAGLKEALTVGTNNSASLASKVDGFNKNAKIRLPFPEDAVRVKEWAMKNGLENKVVQFEETLNRAAEEASKEAAPIFVNAVKEMTVADGFAILKGEEHAATNYLKDKTTAGLKTAFTPKVDKAIESVSLTKYWEPLVNAYNKTTILSGKPKVNTDLTEYVTDRAVSGLFTLIADEEAKIRKDPIARVSDILKRVFGSLD